MVRIRLDSVEIHCYNAGTTTADRIDNVVVSILEGLQQDSPDLELVSLTSSLGLHGIVGGVSALDFLSEFSGSPDVALGPPDGSGAALYFGESGTRASAVLTLDRSAHIAEAVYLKLDGVWNAAAVKPGELPALTRELVEEALAQLRLTIT